MNVRLHSVMSRSCAPESRLPYPILSDSVLSRPI